MEKRYYTATSIERVLHTYERRYEISSDEFYGAHTTDDERLAGMPGFHRQAWAGFYRTWLRMTDTGFVAQAERELELA
jgi:hypothetical protein